MKLGAPLTGIAIMLGAMTAARAEKLAPTRFTIVDEGTAGKPDVILIPGLSGSREVWTREAKQLAPHYRLHLVQIDGFAGQPAGVNASGELLPAIVGELDAYIAANKLHPIVIGHSLGGLLGLMLADQHPADVRALVIVDSLPFYGLLFGPDATVATVKPMGEQLRDKLIAQTAAERAIGAAKTAESLALDPAGRKLVTQNALASDPSVFARAMFEDLQTDLRGDLAKMQTRTLMVYPYDSTSEGADPTNVDALYKSAYAAMPHAQLVRVDASRHFIQLDQPAKLATAIDAFLSKL
jgi:pimeloyl-ACP methyl ester carboxylesterase